MQRRTFANPAPWGLGPGPAKLYSIDGALAAIDLWLSLTPRRLETRRERDLMEALRDVLAYLPEEPDEADLQSAKRAIKGMVKYGRSREAADARIDTYGPGDRVSRRPASRQVLAVPGSPQHKL